MRVLVVDDHPLMRNAMRSALEALMDSVEIDFAGSLEDAFRQSQAADQDLVLLDLNLPDARGSATIGAYCHRLPDKRVVAVSGDDDPRTIRACQNAGAVGFLSKSYDLRRTMGTICKVLAGELAFPPMLDGRVDLVGSPWQEDQRTSTDVDTFLPPPPHWFPAGELPADPAATGRGLMTNGYPGNWTAPAPIRTAAFSPVLAAAPHPDGRHLGLTERQRAVLKLMLRGLPNKLICRELSLAEGTVKVHVSAVLRALNVANRAQVVVAATRAGIRFE